MDKIQEYLKRPLITAGIGFLIGLIIGLPILGWGLMPVRWTDADPSYLRTDLQEDYFCMVIHSFMKTGDSLQAKERLEGLGSVSEEKLANLMPGDCGLSITDIDQFRTALGLAQTVLPAEEAAEVEEAMPVDEKEATEDKKSAFNPFILVGVLCLITLIIGGALAYIFFVRKRSLNGIFPVRSKPEVSETEVDAYEDIPAEFSTPDQDVPITQFMSTYVSGDDLFDDSFSIDSPSGEFLGECGVGISETIGVGDPKKITAFEVWLFDKNDIQTVTKVLMSQHAFDDAAIANRLASKGEPVLLEPGGKVFLETATLVLEARVVDMNYGQGALPENSFFDRLTLELAVWPK
ncbi:MAG: hypothetical protein CVU40_01785 [Chloroflexi bacterium HGW-Chloroflexi-2]|jgi:hypothetical protein|nr:MAG: hypothetical protein CVU40_01785 [Chloroflexi bacterium HGW-Chloroflexi-2]